jgi:hypothetical protein
MEPFTGPKEIWWLNEFQSESDKQRVEATYAENHALMDVLVRKSQRKAALTETPINIYARYRTDLSRGRAWTLTLARFVVVIIAQQTGVIDGSVFERDDGNQYIFEPVPTLEQAETAASKFGRDARVFAVLPRWGFAATEWVAADPELWRSNPVSRRSDS